MNTKENFWNLNTHMYIGALRIFFQLSLSNIMFFFCVATIYSKAPKILSVMISNPTFKNYSIRLLICSQQIIHTTLWRLLNFIRTAELLFLWSLQRMHLIVVYLLQSVILMGRGDIFRVFNRIVAHTYYVYYVTLRVFPPSLNDDRWRWAWSFDINSTINDQFTTVHLFCLISSTASFEKKKNLNIFKMAFKVCVCEL